MKHAHIALFATALVLTACGGRDDADGNNPSASSPMAITASNGLMVSQAAYRSANSSGDMAQLAGSSGFTAAGGGMLAKPEIGRPGLIDTALQIPIGPLELDCAVSGTLTISADIDDPTGQTLSAGDTITADYAACDDGVGEVLDGTLDFEVVAVAGDVTSGFYELTMAMELTNFQSTIDSDVLMANGDATATIDTLLAPYVEASVSGGSMTTDTNTSSETLINYSSSQTLDAGLSPSPYTMLASGTLDSSELSGSINYSTPVMFEGWDSNYPNAGEMLVVGDASSALIIAQPNAVDVVIEIYSNTTASGDPDSTINTTWTELSNQ